MGFRAYCDIDDDGSGKKCRIEMEPLIDKRSGIVYCECGQEMKNQDALTEFAKRQMIALGQIKRTEKVKQAFSVKCDSCKREGPPELSKDGSQLLCSYCNEELKNLNKPFAQMMKQNLNSRRRAGQ